MGMLANQCGNYSLRYYIQLPEMTSQEDLDSSILQGLQSLCRTTFRETQRNFCNHQIMVTLSLTFRKLSAFWKKYLQSIKIKEVTRSQVF